MNTSAKLDFLLSSKASSPPPAPSKAPRSRVDVSEFKGQLEKQLHNAKPTDGLANQSQTTKNKAPNKAEVAEKNVQALDRNRHSAPTENSEIEHQEVSGESLPISEEARKFLAALPEEDQQQVLDEVREWFASLSPEALQNLKQQLEEDPEQLLASLPPELQTLLAKIQKVSLDDLKVTLSAIARDPAVKDNSSLITKEDKSNTKEQASDQNASKQDKLNELVSNLGKASSQGVARAGGEALNQLLQAAGMGLVSSQAAGAGTQTVARMAAGFTSMPLMMQAAAESNAQALANRISMMNAKNLQVAEMRLDPPNLGSVRVQIRMQGEQASVIFQAPNAHARELLEQSLPKLREMMEAEGLMLADAQVSEESFSGQGQEKDGSNQFAGSGLAGKEETLEEMQIPVLTQPLGLIDYYA